MRGDDPSQNLSKGETSLMIRLFGGMTIVDSACTSYLPRSRKTRALVALLTLTAPRPVLRMQLTALLWSQREKEQARASLRQSVHELQETLGPAWNQILLAERHHLTMNLRNVTVDALAAADPTAPRTELPELFQEGFLEDLAGIDPAFDGWLLKERRRWLGMARMNGEAVLQDSPGAAAAPSTRPGSLLYIDSARDAALARINPGSSRQRRPRRGVVRLGAMA